MRTALPLLAGAVLLAVLLAGGCGDGAPIPQADLLLRVTAGAEEVRPGQSFPLTVVRVWSRDLVPAAWDDRALAPLALRAVGVSRREDGRRVEETRRYRAYAFALGDVTVRPPPFAARPRDGGPDRKAPSDPLRLRVRPVLDPDAPGAPDLPGEPLREPFPWGLAAAAAAILGIAVLLAARAIRRRRAARPPRAAAVAPPAPATDAAERALALLRALRARGGTQVEGARAAVAEAAEVVRTYVGERLGVPVAERTTPEILRDARTATGAWDGAGDLLARVLRGGDLAKFAEDRPSPAARAAVLDAAEDFVRRTSPPPVTTGSPRP